jgi:hypothetical protein
MANTLVLLEKVTVGAAGAASVTFNSIPQTGYNDLVIKVSARDTTTAYASSAGISWQIQFNGLTTNLSGRYIFASGSGTPSQGTDASNIYGSNSTGLDTVSTFGNGEIYIPNYTSSNYKSMSIDAVSENNATAAGSRLNAGLWSATAAITSVKILAYSAFAQYSTLSLYGVSNVNTTPTVAPKATGGDIIQTDGTYWYHAFINSGSFTPATALTCDYLVVAGGGGGYSSGPGGGGGAGGLRSTVTTTGGGGSLESALALTSGTAYTVTIGGGGPMDTNGVNTTFSTITSTGGGRGYSPGASGGSGGGGHYSSTAGGAASPSGQGYAGGTANSGGTLAPGGGGGAGAVGNNGATNAGMGGAGVWTALTDAVSLGQLVSSHYYFAGGGGGGGSAQGAAQGIGGSGGGATGGYSGPVVASAALVNSGGGGGGGGGFAGATASAGASGIVIVRYAV